MEEENYFSYVCLSVEVDTKLGQRKLTAICFTRSKPTILVCDYFDNEFYNRSESVLIQWELCAPSEPGAEKRLYLAAPETEWRRLASLLSLLPAVVKVSHVKGAVEVSEEFPSVLKSIHQFSIKRRQARLINWLTVETGLLERGFYGRLSLTPHDSDNFMSIDQAALRALSVFESGKGAETGGVYGYVSRFACTRMGSRVLREWLCQPLRSPTEIIFRQNFVKMFIEDQPLRNVLRGFLKRLPNIDQLLWRLGRISLSRTANFNLADVYRLYGMVVGLEQLVEGIAAASPKNELLLQIFGDLRRNFVDFRTFVESSLDLRRAEQRREYFIDPQNSSELLELHRQSERVEEAVEELRRELSLELKIELKLITQKNGYAFEAHKRKVDDALRERRDRFSILTMRKTTVTFSLAELVALNEERTALSERFLLEQRELVQQVVRSTAGQLPKFEGANFIFAEQDALQALAELFQNPRDNNVFCLAEFDFEAEASRRIELEGSWHLCVKSCIANDCVLEAKNSFALITGPNMGGKSTFIRQVALAALLAQVGCPVPARRCKMTPLSGILTRVGASDAQLRGVSTFMAEMVDVAHLLTRVRRDSLVIIDELGRGTSTYEGLGIAQALCEHLLNGIDCFCLFATHFHELTRLATQFPQMRNYSLQTLDLGTSLEFLYRVTPGAVNRSFGLNIISLLGFPTEIVSQSRAILAELESLG